MNQQNYYYACTESVRADICFDWWVWNKINNRKTKLVYLFITQPEVKYVSISAIACELGLKEQEVCMALFDILNKRGK